MNLQQLAQLFCIIILEVFVLQIVQGNENNDAHFSRIDCISIAKNYLANVSCRVKAVRRDLYLINIQGVFIKPVDNLTIRMKLYKKANTFKPFLVDVSNNFCDFLSKKHVSAYMKIIGSIYLPYSNVNSSCPLVGLQIFKDLPMNAKVLPSIWPTGEYRFDVILNREELTLVRIQIGFELAEKLQTGFRL